MSGPSSGEASPAAGGWFERALAAYTLFALRHRKWVLAIGGALFVLGVALSSRLRVQGDFVELLPSESAAAQRFRAALARKGGGDATLVVLVQSTDPLKNREFVDRLEQRLKALPPGLAKEIDAGPREARAYVERFFWLFLSRAQLERAECELDGEEARRSPGYLGIDEPCDVPGSPAKAYDAPNAQRRSRLSVLSDEIEQRVRAEDRFPEGYYRTSDGKVYALVVRARRAGMGEQASDRLLLETERAARTLAASMGGLDVGFGGDIPTAIAEREALLDDIGVVSVAAVFLVFAAIIAFFRSARALFYVGACVSVGTSLAFAIAWLSFERLNAATSFLGSIIVGNGINYSIVYLSRYAERRRAGAELRQALLDAATTCGRATGLSALAASLSYLSLAATSFRGFSEFGLIGGVGMVLCWLTTFFLLPAMVAQFDSARGLSGGRAGATRRRSLPGFLTEFSADHPRATLLFAGFLFVLALWPLAHYLRDPWEYNFGRLRSQSSDRAGANHYSSLADRVFGSRGAPVLVLAESMKDAPAVARRALELDHQLYDGKFLEKAETIYDRLGGEPFEVEDKLRALARIRSRIDVLSKRATGEELEALRKFRPRDDLRAPGIEDLPKQLREPFTESDGRVGTPVFLSLNRGVSQSRGENLLKISHLLAELRAPSGAPLPNAGRATVFAEMIRAMEQDGPRATLLSLLAVVAVSVIGGRSLSAALCVLGSLVFAVTWLLGIAAVSDLRLNFLNFVALPLTFGIGVEYAINVQDRARAEGGVRAAGRSVAGTVALCSLTTIFGYGALLFADNLALQSFGHYAIIGELTCLVSALLLLPAALTLLQRRKPLLPTASIQKGGFSSVPMDV
ncbi:MAG TPA: MMPL family transporter [Polyangiaceae bacterium]|nr:MMPL family transporter [Polyangiaceae bacterium]